MSRSFPGNSLNEYPPRSGHVSCPVSRLAPNE